MKCWQKQTVYTPLIVAGLIAAGLVNPPPSASQSKPASAPEFEVASVKANHSAERGMMIRNGPGGTFTAKNISVAMLMRMAYKVQDFQIAGAPAWINSERYDIEAKPESSPDADMRKMTDDQREALMDQQRQRVQALLADRFQLRLHQETKELPVYALVIGKNGPKLHESTITGADMEPPTPQGPKGPQFKGQGLRMHRGELSGQAVRLSFLAESLSNQVGRTVIDKTGLSGVYDFTLKWTPEEGEGQIFKGPGDPGGAADAGSNSDASGPSLFTAVQEQLGLKLESQKGPVQILVVDHVERPSEN